VRGYREKRRWALILADLDHFKSINETYGFRRRRGSSASLSARMGGAMRAYDSMGRYGGEEFLIVFRMRRRRYTETSRTLRLALVSEAMALNEKSKTVSAASAPPLGCRGARDREALIRVSDDALYSANANGRNRVVYIPFSENDER